MQISAAPDLTSLAHLAQHPDGDLRPVLLQAQAYTFADAPRRDAGAVAAFEAIALGLIPLVTDDVLSTLAALLRSVPETPATVLAALTERLVRSVPARDLEDSSISGETPGPTAIPVATGSPPSVMLRSTEGASQHDAGGSFGPDIQDDEVGRDHPDAPDLYRSADDAKRTLIRETLRARLPLWPQPLRKPAPDQMRELLMRAAEQGDLDGIRRLLSWQLRLPAEPRYDLDTDAGRELFVCTLLAFGCQPTECIRLILTLDSAMSRSVSTVFRLAAIARATPVGVAALLAGCDDERPPSPRTVPAGDGVTAAEGRLRADGRADPLIDRRPRSDPRGSEATVRAGHRWRSTIGPDRT